MPKPRPHREPPKVDPFRDPAERHWSHWLTRAALVLVVAVVFARATTLETIRNPLDVLPGSGPVPRSTGPAEGLWLDLLACVPALLVLLRRVVDPTFALRLAWSVVPMLALGAWAVASTRWADDKFAALVSSCHLLAAFVLLWATAQLVWSWLRLRLVSAACFGLLLVMVGQGAYYRFVELPDLRAEWRKNGEQILKERGWQPGSFEAGQFEKRVFAGQLLGFTSSPNSFAAVVVLLSVVTGGLFAQRCARREELLPDLAKGAGLPLIALAVALPAASLIVWMTQSRTAMAMVAIGVVAFATIALIRPWLPRYSRSLYAAGVSAFLFGVGVVVYWGMKTGGLVHVSMTFRWRYWVGAAGAFAAHPLLGVGYENFGLHYLTHRLPIAAEEVRDPHNLIVRFVTELGLIGGLLLVAWQLRLWWELTRPKTPAEPPLAQAAKTSTADRGEAATIGYRSGGEASRQPGSTGKTGFAVRAPAVIGGIGLLLSLLTSVDFAQGAAFVGLEVLRRGMLFGVFVLGATIGLVRAVESADADDRPASWLLYGCVVAAGLFLVHNLVDFSFFEAGPMLLFAMVAGAALGARTPTASPAPVGRVVAIGTLVAGVLLWLVVAASLALPVTVAEADAARGDDAVRANAFAEAADAFARAAARVPSNADYPYRAAQVTYWGGDPAGGKRMIDEALRRQPNGVKYLLLRARASAASPTPDWEQILADYRRSLELDPFNVSVRREFADALIRSGDPDRGRKELEEALRVDDLLAADETERLTGEQKAAIRTQIEELGKP